MLTKLLQATVITALMTVLAQDWLMQTTSPPQTVYQPLQQATLQRRLP